MLLIFQATTNVFDADTIQSCIDAAIGWKHWIDTKGAGQNRKTSPHQG